MLTLRNLSNIEGFNHVVNHNNAIHSHRHWITFSNPKILETMQPASPLTKYNVHSLVVIWSPYAPIVSQGAIMTSESLPARLSDPGRRTVRRGKKDGTDWPCMLEALSYMVIGACFSFPERIYTPALPVVAWWWFSARPRSSSMVVQAHE